MNPCVLKVVLKIRCPSRFSYAARDQFNDANVEISVEVLAGQVAGMLSSHPGPPGIGLYPLLKRQSATS
jgi:hypothetical protein